MMEPSQEVTNNINHLVNRNDNSVNTLKPSQSNMFSTNKTQISQMFKNTEIKSTAISNEIKAFERLKKKQEMELLGMVQNELKSEMIRKDNEEKMQRQKGKEDRIKQEIEITRKIEEEKKRQIEMEKQEQRRQEERERKIRDQEKFLDEQRGIKQEQELEKRRLKGARLKQEEEKRKQEEYKQQIEMMLEENMRKNLIKQKQLEEKENLRKEYMERKKMQSMLAKAKQYNKKKTQIDHNMKNLEEKLAVQSHLFTAKQRRNEMKREHFEQLRELAFKEKQIQAKKRSEEIKKVILKNEELGKNKVEDYCEKQKVIEVKKEEIEIQKSEELQVKFQRQHNRDLKIKQTLITNEEMENSKKEEILKKIEIKQIKLLQMNNLKEREMMEKNELAMRKKVEKEETFRDISRMKEAARERTLDRLYEKSQRLDEFKFQKSVIADKKREVQEEINRKKQKYVEEFEKIFKRKTVNSQTIKKLEEMFPDNLEVRSMIQTLKASDSTASSMRQTHMMSASKSRVNTSFGMRRANKNLDLGTEIKRDSFINRTAVEDLPDKPTLNQMHKSINNPTLKPLNIMSEKEITKKANDFRMKLNGELLNLLSQERQKEEDRERILENCTSKVEKQKLEYNFGLERAQSSSKIVDMNEQIDKKVEEFERILKLANKNNP